MCACDPCWRWPGVADDIERLAALVDVVRQLRSPLGCPWDREQTHASLRATLLEEAYEVLEAIDEGSIVKLREELGDVLLQVLMQALIADEAGEFTLGDVADAVREKLVRRHPHVFGSTVVSGSDEVVRNWEALKAVEYGRESALDGGQRSMPALQWFFFSSRRRHTRFDCDWSSDVCSSDLVSHALLASCVILAIVPPGLLALVLHRYLTRGLAASIAR